MRMLKSLLPVLMVSSLALAGDDIKVTGGNPTTNTVEAGKFVFLSYAKEGYDTVTFLPDKSGASFVSMFSVKSGEIYPGAKSGENKFAAHVAPDSKSGVHMVFGLRPGTVTFTAIGAKNNTPIILGDVTLTVVGEGKFEEEKSEDHGKKEEVKPKPAARNVYAALIHDPMTTTPEAALVLNDTAFWDGFKKTGDEWDIFTNSASVDGKETVQQKNGYLKHVEGVALPAMLLLDKETGRKISAVTVTTKANVTETIKAAKGVK